MNDELAFGGLSKLYQNFNFQQLKEIKIIIIGIGGVGSWCAEALVRCGVKKLVLMDLDDICISNTNRQIHTNLETIGKSKIDVMKQRLDLINDDIEVEVIHNFLTEKNIHEFGLEEFDLIIDSFDSLEGKAALIDFCLKKNKKLISCGAAGGKTDATKVTFDQLNHTENDMMFKRLKRKLRVKYGLGLTDIKKVTAIYSSQKAIGPITCSQDEKNLKLNCQGSLGSSVMVTATMGLLAAQVGLEKVIEKRD